MPARDETPSSVALGLGLIVRVPPTVAGIENVAIHPADRLFGLSVRVVPAVKMIVVLWSLCSAVYEPEPFSLALTSVAGSVLPAPTFVPSAETRAARPPARM